MESPESSCLFYMDSQIKMDQWCYSRSSNDQRIISKGQVQMAKITQTI